MDKYYIPQNLDQPFKIIIWTIDEVVCFLTCFIFSFTQLDSPLIGIISGISVLVMLKKLKGEEGQFFLVHLAYWHLPPLVKYKVTPASYIREILG